MDEVIVKSFMEYMTFIAQHCTEQNLFRGIADQAYKLVPKIGRAPYCGKFSKITTTFFIVTTITHDTQICNTIINKIIYYSVTLRGEGQ